MYHVVEFQLSKEVGVVPAHWMTQPGSCLWPQWMKEERVDKLSRKGANPERNWTPIPVRSLDTFASYDEARRKLKKAEYTSDLQSEVESSVKVPRKRVPPKRLLADSGTDDDIEDSGSLLPSAPKLPKHFSTYDPQVSTFSPISPSHTQSQSYVPSHAQLPEPPHSQSYTQLHEPSHEQTYTQLPEPSYTQLPQPSHAPYVQSPRSSHAPSYVQPPRPSIHIHNSHTPSHALPHTPSHALPHTPSHALSHTPSQPSLTFSQYLEQPLSENMQSCSCNKLQLQILQAIKNEVQSHTEVLKTHTRIIEQHTRVLTQFLQQQKGSSSGNQQRAAAASPEPVDYCPITLPIATLDDLEKFENYLKMKENFSRMVTQFASYGGQGLRQVLLRLMQKLLTHELSLQLNWMGRGEKHGFVKYSYIHGIIYRAAKCNVQDNVTLADVEKFIKDWLRSAHDRFGGRKCRQEKMDKKNE